MTTLPYALRAVPELAAWATAQLALLGALGAIAGIGPLGWSAGVAFAVATVALFGRAARRGGTGSPGPADRVTLARALLVGCVTAAVVDPAGGAPDAVVTALAAVALALDFVDGSVARRTGTATAVGARFDMEVDAFLILVLSAHAAGDVGPWVLLIGLMRYAFVAASWALPWLRGALPPSAARKAVAAAQGVALVAVMAVPPPFAGALTGSALAALVWSFGRDVAWLSRTRPRPVEPGPLHRKDATHVRTGDRHARRQRRPVGPTGRVGRVFRLQRIPAVRRRLHRQVR